MSLADIVLLVIISSMVFIAVRHCIRNKGKGCCGTCKSCNNKCNM